MSDAGLIAAAIAAQQESAARIERLEAQMAHVEGRVLALTEQMALLTAALTALGRPS